jgi:signal transduction histidine kinase
MDADVSERLDFLELSPADLELLAALRPVLQRQADRIVAAFYRHLLSFEPTRRLLADPAVKERLLRKQRDYLLSLTDPVVDAAYVAERVRIGDVHERIGLGTRWYLGAYAFYYSLIAPLAADAFPGEPERTQALLCALVRRLMLDAQLAMEAYIERREHELEHLNRELAASGRELQHDLDVQERELRRTQRRVQAAESLASAATVVAGLAHEIGTPMGVIRGHAEALASAVDGERAQWRLRTIVEQIDRISTIIQSLLNVARPRQEPLRAPLDLAAVAEGSLAFLSEKLVARGVRVERAFQTVPEMRGDPDKLQQLFLNLFLNAIDAMPDGGTLRVAIAPAKEGGIEAIVGDTGVGVSPEHLESLFKPFYTTKPAGRGSGLGLAVAEGIVADHGGEIDVRSTLGEGTEFRLRFPESVQPPHPEKTGS